MSSVGFVVDRFLPRSLLLDGLGVPLSPCLRSLLDPSCACCCCGAVASNAPVRVLVFPNVRRGLTPLFELGLGILEVSSPFLSMAWPSVFALRSAASRRLVSRRGNWMGRSSLSPFVDIARRSKENMLWPLFHYRITIILLDTGSPLDCACLIVLKS